MKYSWILLLVFISKAGIGKTTEPTILISIDGFASHYLTQYKPFTLTQLAQTGVSAKALLPVFPTKTFPNHLSMVTGVYPAQHGIIHNRFYHRKLNQNYTLGAGKLNGEWLKAKPIWTLAEQQGVKTAIYFWPESEATIDNILPSTFMPYKHDTPNNTRFDAVLSWLKLPETTRPEFILTYVSTVDSAGHYHSEGSGELKAAIEQVDQLIGDLLFKIKTQTDIEPNVIIVSDHGMTPIDREGVINIDALLANYADKIKVVNGQTQLYFYQQNDTHMTKLSDHLKKQSAGRFNVYLKGGYPKHWHFDHQSNSQEVMPDLIVDAKPPYIFVTKDSNYGVSTHGYDLQHDERLNAIFIANGPAFKQATKIDAFESIHVFSLIAQLHQIKSSQINKHSKNITRSILK